MRFITKILLLVFLGNFTAFAKEAFYGHAELSLTQRGNVSIYGSLVANKAQFENLILMGNLDYKKVKVTDTLTVNGNIEGEELDVNKLVLNGFLSGNKIIIRDGATINGGIDTENLDIYGFLKINVKFNAPFMAKKSNFENIVVAAKKVEFEEVILESIEFEENSKKPELYLKDGCLVKGDIIFKSGDGIIYKSSDSKIEGKVKGGVIK